VKSIQEYLNSGGRGFCQPQARSDPAVRTTATFFVFVYALLLLALENNHLAHSPLPRPRWRRLRP
jgi:hypothetical protein